MSNLNGLGVLLAKGGGESAALSSETHYRLSPFLLWCCPWFVSAVADDSLFK